MNRDFAIFLLILLVVVLVAIVAANTFGSPPNCCGRRSQIDAARHTEILDHQHALHLELQDLRRQLEGMDDANPD